LTTKRAEPGAEPAPRRGRKPDQAKREAIIAAARRLFLAQGYGVSVDSIAHEAGVSKQTVYKAFPGKVDLFTEIASRISEGIVAPLDETRAAAAPPAVVLSDFARHLFEVVYTESSIGLHRVLVAERAQFADLAAAFYRVGPGAMRLRLAQYIARETERGRLYAADPEMAAEHFLGMLSGHRYLRRLLGLEEHPTPESLDRRIKAAVEAFLRAYAPMGDGTGPA
jgi:TetR/AcrR family transcriptional repressor of mexJK operon